MDASDLCLGTNELEDHKRCCDEVAHIRAALRLATQTSKRRIRATKTDSEQSVFGFGAARDSSSGSDGSVDSDEESSKESLKEDVDGDVESVSRNSLEDSFAPMNADSPDET